MQKRTQEKTESSPTSQSRQARFLQVNIQAWVIFVLERCACLYEPKFIPGSYKGWIHRLPFSFLIRLWHQECIWILMPQCIPWNILRCFTILTFHYFIFWLGWPFHPTMCLIGAIKWWNEWNVTIASHSTEYWKGQHSPFSLTVPHGIYNKWSISSFFVTGLWQKRRNRACIDLCHGVGNEQVMDEKW